MNRTKFLALPSGVIYSLCRKDLTIDEELYIKYDSLEDIDWVEASLLDIPATTTYSRSTSIDDTIEESFRTGKSFQLNYGHTMYNGFFESEQLFAVYEKEDVEKLVSHLKNTLPSYPSSISSDKTK